MHNILYAKIVLCRAQRGNESLSTKGYVATLPPFFGSLYVYDTQLREEKNRKIFWPCIPDSPINLALRSATFILLSSLIESIPIQSLTIIYSIHISMDTRVITVHLLNQRTLTWQHTTPRRIIIEHLFSRIMKVKAHKFFHETFILFIISDEEVKGEQSDPLQEILYGR